MPDASGPSAESVVQTLLQALDEGALVFDATGACKSVGRRAAELLGVEASTILALPRADLLRAVASAADAPGALAPLERHDPSERTVVDPIELTRPIAAGAPPSRSGRFPRTIVWTSVPVTIGHDGGQPHAPGAGDPVEGRLDLIRDVTRERRAETAAEDLAHRLELESTLDDVTGLVNRRRFDEECLREHRRAQREWITYAIACIDVDDMAAINERDGRAMGDALLKRVGEQLRSSRREYDVVARGTGDQFIVLLPRADARALDRVLKRALASVRTAGGELAPGMSVSVGAAIWTPPSAEAPADILRRAEAALAAARARGAGRVEIDHGSAEWKDDEGPDAGA